MTEKKVIVGQLMDEVSSISYVEICEKYQLSETELLDMMEHGLLEYPAQTLQKARCDQYALAKIQAACRLQQDLGLNMAGVVLVLDMLEELEQLRGEISILRRHIDI